MYMIELTRGAGWNASILEAHSVKSTIHIADAERIAQSLLAEAQRKPNRLRPTGYRIVDALGKRIKAHAI